MKRGILIEYTNDPTELDYSNYTMLPICIEQADEVAFTLDKLIKQGKIPKDGIFYKYLKDFLQVYISPTEYAWDPEVIEFFKTLKWLGGQSTHCKHDKRSNVAWHWDRGYLYSRNNATKFRWAIR